MNLAGLLSLILTFVSSLPPNLATAFIEKKLKKAKLKKISSDLRKYLLQRTSEYDHERLEDYLSSNGYSTQYEDDILPNDILDAAVSDFFAKNQDVFYNKESLTPILKSAIQYAHSELYKTLSTEHRLLYKQNATNQKELLHEFDDVKKQIDSLQESKKNIPADTVSRLYSTAIASIKSGYINIANDLLNLLPEFNLASSSMPLYLALKIQVDYFLTAIITEADVKRFSSLSPNVTTVLDVVTFLFQTHNYQKLKHLVHSIKDQNILNLIQISNDDNQPDAIRNRLTENLVVHSCYLEYEATFWYIANYQVDTLSYSEAERHFQEISKRFPNIWADYYASQSKIQNFLSQHLLVVKLNNEVHGALENELRNFLHYFFVLSGCDKSFIANFWDVFLLAASSLDRKTFLSLVKEYPSDQKIDSVYISADYNNMLDNSVAFDSSSFIAFCDSTKNTRLLLHYIAILFDNKNFEEIIEILKERESFLKDNIIIVDIYIQSIVKIIGANKALEVLYSLQRLNGEEYDYLVLEAALLDLTSNDLVDEVLSKAYDISLKPGIERMSLSGISSLANLLYKYDRFENAITLLDIYCKQSTPLLFEKLRMLMKKDVYTEECSTIIEQLISKGFLHPLIYQYRGALKEKKLEGSGLADFEKAFSIEPSIQTAYSILVARILVSKNIDDSVLNFATKAENPQLSWLVAQVYQKLHSPDLETFYILKALLETNEAYDEKIYGYFFMHSIYHASKKLVKPSKIQENTVVTLKSNNDNRLKKICFHNESNLIPSSGTCFAGCIHTDCFNSDFLKMKYKRIKNSVLWHGETCEIISIEDRISYFANFCSRQLIDFKSFKSIFTKEPQELLKEIASIEAERSANLEQTLEQYYNSQFGLPIHTIAIRFGKTDLETMKHILYSDRPFMSGIYDLTCSQPYLLTLSTLYLLALLGVSCFPESCKSVFYVSYFTINKLETECEVICRDAEFTAAILFTDNNRPSVINYNDDIRATIHSQIADIRSLADNCSILEELSPDDYIEDIRQINDNIGRDNYESISMAKTKSLSLICDDLCIRRIAHTFGVNSANVIDVIILLDLGYSKVIELVSTLLTLQYQFPITFTLLNYFASEYDLLIEANESTDAISMQISTLFDLVSEKQIFWMNFLNQTWMFARQEILRNIEFSRLVFKYALVISAKVDLQNLSSELDYNTKEEE